MSTLRVLEPGLRSTVQDRGRYGHLRSAVPTAGPADPVAFEAALHLVGNEPSAAVVEIVGLPFRAVLDRPGVIAVTGRDVRLRSRSRIDGWTAAFVRAGEELAVLGSERTRYAYLAVGGGIAVPEVLGSRATYVTTPIGPVPRALESGDTLPLGDARHGPERAGRHLPFEYAARIPAMRGPHADRVGAGRGFFARRFTVSERSDRMGVRLEGALAMAAGEILPVGVVSGAVQVPGGGEPIVLLADHGTTGGYPVVAAVGTLGLASVAQAAPGEEVEFREVDRAAAVAALREWRARLA